MPLPSSAPSEPLRHSRRPVGLGDRLDVAGVVAEVQHPARERGAGLDRAGGVVGPDDAPVAAFERVHGAVLGAEEEPAVVEQGRGLAARWAGCATSGSRRLVTLTATTRPAAPGARASTRGVHGVARDGGGRGRERAQAVGPDGVAGLLVDGDQDAVVGELEDAVAVDHGRELEQRAAAVRPQLLERGAQAGGSREEAGVVLGVAV